MEIYLSCLFPIAIKICNETFYLEHPVFLNAEKIGCSGSMLMLMLLLLFDQPLRMWETGLKSRVMISSRTDALKTDVNFLN